MIMKILKIWLGGLCLYLIIIFLIPNKNINSNDTNITLYNQEYSKNIKNLQRDMNFLLYKKQKIVVKIIVNRLEFVIYYLFFKSYVKYNNYEIYIIHKDMTIKNILFYYHKTIYEIFYESYLIIKDHIKRLSR